MRRGNTGPFVHCRRVRVLCLPIVVPTCSLLSFFLFLSFSVSKKGDGNRKNLFALNSQQMYNGCKFSCLSATIVKRWKIFFISWRFLHSSSSVSVVRFCAYQNGQPLTSVLSPIRGHQSGRLMSLYVIICLLFQCSSRRCKFPIDYDH